ncbi:metallophosphoesterase family protein [Aerococcus sanguinicola]|uniref:metallophosphoesterase family protein n=1 Tax=unclassified Aerococcus TaxID=2618060 RepID=UPI0008A20184|nr:MULTISPECIES: hypothetical protein [unclassified Aerococcus]KAB0646530.1 calcineurin phosphoesterase [Aerococcus sanguinicola]MDK6233806.1 hypothetical protein [Aerococcus sp. UMB10185]MDK6855886.1 hypothetical protein [Aerococcus sp. UMB7533]OFN03945.1 hypothetical protein HMPREF2626_04830 [Aerococcus sp. HMSC062A02]OHO43498.1 hypothetical protein HMPREF2705_01745 [Aerococcus sp. HMSC035B07]
MRPGRLCPSDYAIEEKVYEKDFPDHDKGLYIIGGLYGNPYALDEIEAMQVRDPEPVSLCFNGDTHWFDCDPDLFQDLEERLNCHYRSLGNVEAELLRTGDQEIGCGCAYPSSTSDAAVSRSNAIHKRLKEMVRESQIPVDSFQDLGKVQVFTVYGLRLLVLHGDEKFLAGWGCSAESLQEPGRQQELEAFMESYQIDVIACTHTCSQVIYEGKATLVINNGSAGMGTLAGDPAGLIIRLGQVAHPDAIYSKKMNHVYVELLRVAYDLDLFMSDFDQLWPSGSAAAVSYRERLIQGTSLPLRIYSPSLE